MGGPKYNISDKYKVVKPATPRFSIAHKRKSGKEALGHETPGPMKYNPPQPQKYKKAPAFSIRTRNKKRDKHDETPGPCAYVLPSTRKAGSCTMKGRWKNQKKDVVPAPNQYNPSRGAKPKSARSCTISARNFQPDYTQYASPGPAVYQPVKPMGYRSD